MRHNSNFVICFTLNSSKFTISNLPKTFRNLLPHLFLKTATSVNLNVVINEKNSKHLIHL